MISVLLSLNMHPFFLLQTFGHTSFVPLLIQYVAHCCAATSFCCSALETDQGVGHGSSSLPSVNGVGQKQKLKRTGA